MLGPERIRLRSEFIAAFTEVLLYAQQCALGNVASVLIRQAGVTSQGPMIVAK